jgi:hypothetical protein
MTKNNIKSTSFRFLFASDSDCRTDRRAMRRERLEAERRVEVPEPDGGVGRSADEHVELGQEAQARDGALVIVETHQASLADNVPNDYATILRNENGRCNRRRCIVMIFLFDYEL